MDLHIFGIKGAIAHVPTVPTYAIRLFSSYDHGGYYQRPLQNSPLFVATKVYVVDDVDPRYCPEGRVVITDEIADRILEDFLEKKDEVEAVLVQCSHGRNRSPAVGMALNQIFGWGYSYSSLERQHELFTKYIYHKMFDAGVRKGLCDESRRYA